MAGITLEQLTADEESREALRVLPFVTEAESGAKFWDPSLAQGHDATDIGIGESYARLALDVARRLEMPGLICMVLRDMVAAGKFTGLEAGFVVVVSSAARSGSMN